MSPVRPSARVRTRSQASREKLKEEREQILLWKQPLTTVNYSTRELLITLFEGGKRYVHKTNTPFLRRKLTVVRMIDSLEQKYSRLYFWPRVIAVLFFM